MPAPIISIRGLHKWYSGVHALNGIDLDLESGEPVGSSATMAPANPLSSKCCRASSFRIAARSGRRPACRASIAEVGDAARDRDRLPVQFPGAEYVGGAQSLHRTRTADGSRLGGVGIIDQRKMREDFDARHRGRRPSSEIAGHLGGRAVRRPATRRRHRARHVLQVEGSHSRRADQSSFCAGRHRRCSAS